MEEGALVWRRAPWCGGGRPGVEKGFLVWMRMPRCHWQGEVACQVRRRAPLRRESSESTSDISRKRTRLAPYAKTPGGATAPGRPSLYPPLQRPKIFRKIETPSGDKLLQVIWIVS